MQLVEHPRRPSRSIKDGRCCRKDDGASGGTARNAVRLVEELKGAIGVDLPKLLDAAVQSDASKAPPPPPMPKKDL